MAFGEISAGAVLLWETVSGVQALLIRVRREGYELPKGHIEDGERPEQTALRELQEETGIRVSLASDADLPGLGTVHYSFQQADRTISKVVSYFLIQCRAGEEMTIGRKPSRTRELRWIREEELAGIAFVSEPLRPIVARAFQMAQEARLTG